MAQATISVVEYTGTFAAQGDRRPVEQVSFRYGQIEMEYTPMEHAGRRLSKHRQGWDLFSGQAGLLSGN